MTGKRKSRDYYIEEKVTVGEILEKYPAIKDALSGDAGLMKASVRVPDDMYHSLGLGGVKK